VAGYRPSSFCGEAAAVLATVKGLDRHGKRGGRAWNLIGMWARR
jgi:hypothetical protein